MSLASAAVPLALTRAPMYSRDHVEMGPIFAAVSTVGLALVVVAAALVRGRPYAIFVGALLPAWWTPWRCAKKR